MTYPAEEQLYPFSAQNAQAIPLDIIRPTGIISKSFAAAAVTLTLPADMKVAAFYSTAGCFVSFGPTAVSAIADGVHYPETLFVPPYVSIVASVRFTTAKVIPMSAAGTLTVQGIYPWASVALPRELNKKI